MQAPAPLPRKDRGHQLQNLEIYLAGTGKGEEAGDRSDGSGKFVGAKGIGSGDAGGHEGRQGDQSATSHGCIHKRTYESGTQQKEQFLPMEFQHGFTPSR